MKSPLAVSLAGMIALAVAMGIGRFAFTPILPLMLDEESLSLASGGMLASANYIGYFAGALAATFFPVRPEHAIRFGMLGIGMATLAMAWGVSLAAWLLLRCIAGIASAWVLVSVSAWSMSKLAQHDKPFLNGVVFAGVGIGIAAAGLVCLLLAELHGGASLAWSVTGGMALLLTVLTWRAFAAPVDNPHAASARLVKAFKWDAQSVRMVIVYGIFGFGYIIPATFLPVMARSALSDPSLSAWSWPLFGMVGAVSVLFAGKLSSRIGNLPLWAACHAILAAGVALPALFAGLLPVMLAALCVGGTFMVITLTALQEAKSVSTDHSSMLIAAMTSAFALGQIVGPLAVSLLSGSSTDFKLILLLSSALMGGSALMLMKNFGRKYGKPNVQDDNEGIQS